MAIPFIKLWEFICDKWNQLGEWLSKKKFSNHMFREFFEQVEMAMGKENWSLMPFVKSEAKLILLHNESSERTNYDTWVTSTIFIYYKNNMYAVKMDGSKVKYFKLYDSYIPNSSVKYISIFNVRLLSSVVIPKELWL